jgi:hypothetical protein
MILPPLTADVSLYKSGGHYRSSAPAGRTNGIVLSRVLPQSTARNVYVTQTACQIAGWWGWVTRAWAVYTCYPRYFSGDPDPWYQLYTTP